MCEKQTLYNKTNHLLDYIYTLTHTHTRTHLNTRSDFPAEAPSEVSTPPPPRAMLVQIFFRWKTEAWFPITPCRRVKCTAFFASRVSRFWKLYFLTVGIYGQRHAGGIYPLIPGICFVMLIKNIDQTAVLWPCESRTRRSSGLVSGNL